MERYVPTKNILDEELLGCHPDLKSKANFINLLGALERILALCYTRARAKALVLEVDAEAEDLVIPIHEYVINELQYERRVALANEKEPLQENYELAILNSWCKTVMARFGDQCGTEFIEQLKIDRAKRTR